MWGYPQVFWPLDFGTSYLAMDLAGMGQECTQEFQGLLASVDSQLGHFSIVC